MLRHLGYDVTAVDSAEAALDAAAQAAFDVLVTDVYLAGVPGDELVARMREVQPSMLAIVVTAHPDMDLAIRTVNRGARRFLVKPVTLKVLEEALDEVLAQRREAAARAQRELAERLLEQHQTAGEHLDLQALLDTALEDLGDGAAGQAGRAGARIIVLCEPVGDDVEAVRSAPRFRHLRTLYRAQQVLNGQLRRAGAPGAIRLVIVRRAADLARCLQEHGERVQAVVLGPNFHRQSLDLLRLLAVSRPWDTVICHATERADFAWATFNRLAGDLSLHGYRASVSAQETATFWAEYLSQHVRPGLQAPAAAAPARPDPERNLLAARSAMAHDPVAADLLPAFPAVCQRMAAAIDAGAGFEALADIAALDGPLQATLVHRANAAVYGTQRIESVAMALSVIGTAEAKELLLGRAMGQIVRRVERAGFSNRDFFLHATAVGYLAQMLCLDTDGPAAEEAPAGLPRQVVDGLRLLRRRGAGGPPPGFDAFGAGVLHDLGKVVMATCYPDTVGLTVHEIRRGNWPGSRQAEALVSGNLAHAAVGAALLERWDLFREVRDPILRHHDIGPGSSPEAVVVALANCLAKGMYPFPVTARIPQPQREEVLGLPDLDTGDGARNPLVPAFAALVADFEERCAAVDVRPCGPPLVTVARQAAREEGGVYLQLLLRQNPEFVPASRRAGSSPEDLLALGLLLREPVVAYVTELLSLTTTSDPIVRRTLAA